MSSPTGRARRRRPGVVVGDVRGPGTDGSEVTRQSRRAPDGPHVPAPTTFDLGGYAFRAPEAHLTRLPAGLGGRERVPAAVLAGERGLVRPGADS